MNKKNNRRGQVFVVMVIIIVTGALLAAAIILHSLYQDPNPDQFLGRYQSAIVDSMNDGNKIVTYVDEAAKMSVASAFDEYLYGNPNPLTNVEGGDPETKYCGSYVYRLWNTLNKDCYPDYKSSDFELNALIDKHLTALTRDQKSSKDNPPEEQYFESLITQDITYTYSYTPTAGYTNILGTPENQYTVNIFKDKNTATSTNIQNYLIAKSAYSGNLIWPLDNNFYIASCFGYRGTVNTASGVGASTNHPGVDIPAPRDTPVHAAASGKIIQKNPIMGEFVIDHGNGLQTEYMHMNTFAKESVGSGKELDVGSAVTQGQVIGYVGGRGENGPDTYGNHLHFAVRSMTVDPNTNYDGISAIVKSIYVNPLCFVSTTNVDGTQKILAYDMNDKSCNSICNSDGSSCACGETSGSTKCSNPASNPANSAPYKFCSVYEGVATQKLACIKTDKTDWKIENIAISGTTGASGSAGAPIASGSTITSDQTLTISMTIENGGDTCVNVQPELSIVPNSDNSKLEITDPTIDSVNIYPKTDKTPQTIAVIATCIFTTDKTEYMKAIADKKCILYAPDDGSTREYSVDAKITDYNNLQQFYNGKIKFTIKKGTGTSSADTSANTVNSNNAQTSASSLSNSDKAQFDMTKQNLADLGVRDYITEISSKDGVPKEIVLGLITQESGGKLNPPGNSLAKGLMQITQDTFKGTNFDAKCSWDQYMTDADCQIRAGIAVLKKKYDAIKGKSVYYSCNSNCKGLNSDGKSGYWPSCSNGCSKTDCMGPVNKQYTDWEAALRRYNGGGDLTLPNSGSQTSGCTGQPDYNYVEKVMKFADAWGYSETSDLQTQDELYVGILGQYHINPMFNIRFDFDMSLFDMLKKFANNTVNTCGKEGLDKMQCIKDNVDAFNNNLPLQYKQTGVVLKTDCDTSDNMAEVNKFVEEINNCMSSTDDMCQCDLSDIDSYAAVQSIESIDGSTKVSYYADDYSNELTNAYFDYSVMQNNKFFTSKNAWLNTINLYKNGTKLQTNFITDKKCGYVKNTYRLCLVTRYSYDAYSPSSQQNSGSITTKYVTIPFAIMVRDNVAPKPISKIESQALPHSNNSVILEWNAGTEGDIVRYSIYLSDSEYDFLKPTANLRKTIAYKSVDSLPKDYSEYKSIDFTNPVCNLKEDASKGIKYCVFNYTAVDKDDKTVSIQLEKEKLYYISNEKKFTYIIDGSNITNALVTGAKKFIAVTAVDIEGNEIDNIESNQKITSGINLINITPENKVEPGFVQISSQSISPDKTVLALSWDKLGIYIDGTPITDTSHLDYDIFLSNGDCAIEQLNDVSQDSQVQSTPNTNIAITLPQSNVGLPEDYCVYVLSDIDNNKYLKGFAINSKDITVGLPNP